MKYKEVSDQHKDPVCGMEVSRISAIAESTYKGVTYYFCAGICKDAFEQDPERYVRHRSSKRPKAQHG